MVAEPPFPPVNVFWDNWADVTPFSKIANGEVGGMVMREFVTTAPELDKTAKPPPIVQLLKVMVCDLFTLTPLGMLQLLIVTAFTAIRLRPGSMWPPQSTWVSARFCSVRHGPPAGVPRSALST